MWYYGIPTVVKIRLHMSDTIYLSENIILSCRYVSFATMNYHNSPEKSNDFACNIFV